LSAVYHGGWTGWSVLNVKMPEYNVPSTSLVHLSGLPAAVLVEIGAHAGVAARVAAAIIAASLHTLRMGRIIAHLAN
jgi:hypothetical protein